MGREREALLAVLEWLLSVRRVLDAEHKDIAGTDAVIALCRTVLETDA